MNHKRRRPKNRRAGCLLCKPQKANGQKASVRDAPVVKRANDDAREQLSEDDREDVAQVLYWEE